MVKGKLAGQKGDERASLKELVEEVRQAFLRSRNPEVKAMAKHLPRALKVFEYIFAVYDAAYLVKPPKGFVLAAIEVRPVKDDRTLSEVIRTARFLLAAGAEGLVEDSKKKRQECLRSECACMEFEWRRTHGT